MQTPTLAMLVDRESKIMNFKKEAYYMAHIIGNGLDAVSEHISDKTEVERIAGACENGQALVTSVVKEEKHRRSSMTLPHSRGMQTVCLALLPSRHWNIPRAFMKRNLSLIRERTASTFLMIWMVQQEM